jgi:FAD/FMN-containing dehydrogenase
MVAIDPTLLEQLRELLGDKGIREEPHPAWPNLVLKPASTDEVAGILKLCNAAGQPLIPWAGKTGLVDSLNETSAGEIGLSMERMNAVEEIDEVNRTCTVQAGCILQVAAEACEEKGLFLPLDMGARGSATVGGNVATNAGGNRVIRYGMMREMVLGLEVVLADGTVVSSLNKMIKNNTGYDLKQWFIGSEGTLGVITRVVIRLRPLPKSQNTALVACQDFDRVTRLLGWMDANTAGTLSAFECMWPFFYEHVTREGSLHSPPLAPGYSFYVLVETLGSDPEQDLATFEAVLGEAWEQELIEDAVIAKSDSERHAIWEIRDDVLGFFELGPVALFDVSVTVDRMAEFVAGVDAFMSGIEEPINVTFGHLGDSNLHLMLGTRKAELFDKDAIESVVYDLIKAFGGSVSAEHGIGMLKREHLSCSRSPEELHLMYTIKRALDPGNILSPNKIFTADKVITHSEEIA